MLFFGLIFSYLNDYFLIIFYTGETLYLIFGLS